MRNIQPLGEQIIIRTIPQSQFGSIIVADSVKGIITLKGDDGQAVHFVEAEVIAVGPGKRNTDPALIGSMRMFLTDLIVNIEDSLSPKHHAFSSVQAMGEAKRLLQRSQNGHQRQALSVKPGDRIVFHPAVQSFDRDVTDFLSDGTEPLGTKYFLISEERSALAVIERDTDYCPECFANCVINKVYSCEKHPYVSPVDHSELGAGI